MTLPELKLDDLTWEDLVDRGRRAIPAASDGRWTLRGPVDPGITLLELFAYQLEQRLFMLDRVPATLVRAVIERLAGPAAAPRPAQAATTVLTLRPPGRLVVPAGTEFTRILDGRELVLTTTMAAVVTPGATVERAEIDGVDLRPGTGVPFFGRSGTAPARLRLRADEPPAEHLLYVGVDGDPADGPPDDGVRWGTDLDVEDGTGGLRRSGIVRVRARDGLPLPAVLDLVVSRAPSSGPVWPRVTTLALNAVPAADRRRVRVTVPAGPDAARAVPNRVLLLPQVPPIDDPARFRVTVGSDERWTVVADLAFSGPDDRHVSVDRPGGRLLFGDGRSGRVPRWAPGTPIRLDYWVGGGVAPDVGPGVEVADGLAVTVTRLAGGAEPEPIAAARTRLAGELAEVGRAISAADVEAIVRAVPGTRISRVHVRPARSGDHADVFCVPAAPRRDDEDLAALPAPGLDGWTIDRVTAALDRARLIGFRFGVRGPAYRPVAVVVTVDVHARDRATAERRIAVAVRRHLDPLAFPFGAPVGPPDLTVVAQRALGDHGEVISVSVGEPGATPTDCEPLPLRPHELPAVASVTVRGRR